MFFFQHIRRNKNFVKILDFVIYFYNYNLSEFSKIKMFNTHFKLKNCTAGQFTFLIISWLIATKNSRAFASNHLINNQDIK